MNLRSWGGVDSHGSKVQGITRKLRQGRRKYITRAKAVKGISSQSVGIISTDAEVTKNDGRVGEDPGAQFTREQAK